jgi:hypothetical protein
MDPRIRIHIKMSWICNTAKNSSKTLLRNASATGYLIGGRTDLLQLDKLHPEVGEEDPELGIAALIDGIPPRRHLLV